MAYPRDAQKAAFLWDSLTTLRLSHGLRRERHTHQEEQRASLQHARCDIGSTCEPENAGYQRPLCVTFRHLIPPAMGRPQHRSMLVEAVAVKRLAAHLPVRVIYECSLTADQGRARALPIASLANGRPQFNCRSRYSVSASYSQPCKRST